MPSLSLDPKTSVSISSSFVTRKPIAYAFGLTSLSAFFALTIFSKFNSPSWFISNSHLPELLVNCSFSTQNLNETREFEKVNETKELEKLDEIKDFDKLNEAKDFQSFILNKECDIYDGSWVKDVSYYPFYDHGSCPLIDDQFNCYQNGRKDDGYERLKWQPNGCNIPSTGLTETSPLFTMPSPSVVSETRILISPFSHALVTRHPIVSDCSLKFLLAFVALTIILPIFNDHISSTRFYFPTFSSHFDFSRILDKLHKRKHGSFSLNKDCNIYNGSWVKDFSYPFYEHGSCPLIDQQFNCYQNGRKDDGYERLRWQPNGCNIPRLNGKRLLELLRGKRLVYVGDSLNRNMWESMVCILRNSVEDKSKVFEASGKNEFRTENSYSFLFTEYNCSVEFFGSSYLVQHWENPSSDGSKKSTLRLDMVESSDRFRSADVLVFNTGHWWTRGRTFRGKGYFQEGNHIYKKLNIIDAFTKALMTWGNWVDNNIDPSKTTVFFRSYSPSHFRGGNWNSGGQCDHESEPIYNTSYLILSPFLEKMKVVERVIKKMKTPVVYLNITRLTDYRKDAHPSVYRKPNLTDEERQAKLNSQDCSHWCLPGVPDTWNQLLFAQLLLRYNTTSKQ